ncbi:acetyl-CoA hydrolase/transferase C-terminal domain-containing protein [Arthrobacter sp. efr-133-R2A-120]|uniref:acetyl-CoA hydrolase/transferase C-terminal domain-containing protein n=1 Tax=Arthrobacter sp. efr-133-R2A-120 TaxID=3040277 RepID=UPI00254BDDCC|nr:acetyl-CoA hydrolase/transferase C-terminal domain-containing protein [Arthrobacter sp. efr-133-R2A-120]
MTRHQAREGRAYVRAAAEILDGKDHLNLVSAMSPQQPTRLIATLLSEARRREIRVSLYVSDLTARFAFLDDNAEDDLRSGRLRITMLAGGAPLALAHLVDSLPVSLWETDRLLSSGVIPCDVYAVRVARGVGGFELGNAVGFTPTLAAMREVRLAVEVAPAGEYMGGLFPTPSEWWADAVTVSDDSAAVSPVVAAAAAEPVRDRIAELVAGLIPGDATLEVGLGGVADALIGALATRPGIGIHSGILPWSLREYLVEGSYTAVSKTVDPGLNVATGLAVDAGAAAWPETIRLHPVSLTHDPFRLAQQHKLWGVNSGFSVDLSGQVNAEWVGGVKVAVGGGQHDFTRASHQSVGGASVIALPSRSGRGLGRIVKSLAGLTPVTTSASDVDFVVTEWGIAELGGQSLEERARALIAIAHPEDRDGLCASVGN